MSFKPVDLIYYNHMDFFSNKMYLFDSYVMGIYIWIIMYELKLTEMVTVIYKFDAIIN